jgi:hypothetical protein
LTLNTHSACTIDHMNTADILICSSAGAGRNWAKLRWNGLLAWLTLCAIACNDGDRDARDPGTDGSVGDAAAELPGCGLMQSSSDTRCASGACNATEDCRPYLDANCTISQGTHCQVFALADCDSNRCTYDVASRSCIDLTEYDTCSCPGLATLEDCASCCLSGLESGAVIDSFGDVCATPSPCFASCGSTALCGGTHAIDAACLTCIKGFTEDEKQEGGARRSEFCGPNAVCSKRECAYACLTLSRGG